MNKKQRSFFLTLACLVAGLLSPSRGSAVQLYNTGVDDNGNRLPLLSLERHFTLTGPLPTVYVEAPDPNWYVTAPAGSAWIGPNSGTYPWPSLPTGTYRYRQTFDLSGYTTLNLRISGFWATDNTAEIWLNDVYTGVSLGDWAFTSLHPFEITSGFVPGLNVLEFRVENLPTVPGGNPTGLLVSGMSLEVVPEPSVPALTGLVSVILLRRFRQQ